MPVVAVVVGVGLAALVAGGTGGFFAARGLGRGAAEEAQAIQAPTLTDAQARLAVAQWPALQVATAAALQVDPPPCAMEYAAYLASIQGGTDGQAMSATDTRGMAEKLQDCMGGGR